MRVVRPGAVGRIAVHYDASFFQLISFRARTISPDGHERVYSRKDAADVPALASFELYADSRALVLDLSRSPAGTIIEYEATVRMLEPGLFSVGQTFGERSPAARVALRVHAPIDWKLEWQAGRLHDRVPMEPRITEVAGERSYEWVKTDVPVLPDEPSAPALALSTLRLRVRLASWREHGQSRSAPADARALSAAHYAIAKQPDPTPELGAFARSLTEGAASDRERAAHLYRWVRDQVSYCAIEIGIGGYRPHLAEKTLELRYGDCKDKANLLRALLQTVHIESRLVTIYHHDGYPRRFAMPTMDNFNHAILAVKLGGEWTLTDPTSRVAPFGSLPSGDEGADVLPVAAEGAALEQSPERSAADNRRESHAVLALKAALLEGEVNIRVEGAHADALRQKLLDHVDASDVFAHDCGLASPRVSEVHVDDATPPESPRPVVGHARVQLGWRAPRAKTVVLRARDVLAPMGLTLPDGPRSLPLVLGAAGVRDDSVEVTLPGDWQVESLPEIAHVEGALGSYVLEVTRMASGIRLRRRLDVTLRTVEPSGYEEARRFYEAIHHAENVPLLLRRPSP